MKALAAVILCLALGGCANVTYFAADGKTPTQRATAYFPYEYEHATGNIVLNKDCVQKTIDGVVTIGPPAVEAIGKWAGGKAPAPSPPAPPTSSAVE